MNIEVPIINAFVDGQRGGNPAGVVLDAERFNTAQKQQIAAAVGLSETAFVSPSTVADFKLEFFTPSRQIAHCGHATVATFSYLRQIGVLDRSESSKETIDGCRSIHLDGDKAYMEQLPPSYRRLTSVQRIALLASLRLDPKDLLSGAEPQVVNTGNGFMIVGVKDAQTLIELNADLEAINNLSEQLNLIGFYLFSPETHVAGRQAGTRMFAPRYGINEEAATGMAAGPLACYLHDLLGQKRLQIEIEQGHLMPAPSPSLIDVRLQQDSKGHITSLMAGGRADVREVRQITASN